MQSIIIGPNQAGQRFDKFLHKCLPEAQNSFLYKMLRKKNITLNGKKAEGKEMLKEGDEVKLFFAEETFAKFAGKTAAQSAAMNSAMNPAAGAAATKAAANSGQQSSGFTAQYREALRRLKGITVIYEDDHVLILNKPAGILTQKASDSDVSLNEWMIGYLLSKGSITEQELVTFKPSVCNRLDRNTSGLVLCGKSLPGSQALSRVIHDRTVKKFYRTIVSGSVSKDAKIDGYLIKNEKTNKVQVFSSVENQSGERIQTAYHVIDHFSHSFDRSSSKGFTYLEVELITGKTHQIRAHLASTGHALIGDYKYGNKRVNDGFRDRYGLSSQLLHAYRLEFPETNGALEGLSGKTVIAPLPELFTRILADFSQEEA